MPNSVRRENFLSSLSTLLSKSESLKCEGALNFVWIEHERKQKKDFNFLTKENNILFDVRKQHYFR
jgi:hypothetical protein